MPRLGLCETYTNTMLRGRPYPCACSFCALWPHPAPNKFDYTGQQRDFQRRAKDIKTCQVMRVPTLLAQHLVHGEAPCSPKMSCVMAEPRLLEMFSYLLYLFLSKIDAIHVFHVCFICSCLYAHMLRIFNLNI